MPRYQLEDRVPEIHPEAFVHPDAVLIGTVVVEAEATVWPGAVLRGDYGRIVIGARSSIQDNAVLHAVPIYPTVVGQDCVVGHLAHLEGCTLEDGCLVGSGSIVLHQAVVGKGATVGAGAVVPNRMTVPPGALAVGVPAKIKEGASSQEAIALSAEEYVRNGRRYRQALHRLD